MHNTLLITNHSVRSQEIRCTLSTFVLNAISFCSRRSFEPQERNLDDSQYVKLIFMQLHLPNLPLVCTCNDIFKLRSTSILHFDLVSWRVSLNKSIYTSQDEVKTVPKSSPIHNGKCPLQKGVLCQPKWQSMCFFQSKALVHSAYMWKGLQLVHHSIKVRIDSLQIMVRCVSERRARISS